LEKLAERGWEDFEERSPEYWRAKVSTFLKAYACTLRPTILLAMADLLAMAGYKGAAREALEVVLTFPSYAHIMFAGAKDYQLTAEQIVKSAQKALRNL
jgi:hypothetical protein